MVGRTFLRRYLTVPLPFSAVPAGEKGSDFTSERSEKDLDKDRTAGAFARFLVFSQLCQQLALHL